MKALWTALAASVFFLDGFMMGSSAPNQEDLYYLPCEVVATNEASTYFGAVDQDTQQIYAVNTGDHQWPDDVPYLLHVDSMGTKDVTDDEILVVWRTD